ncbi:MAG: pseudouridine synthase [Nitrospirales bacterium]|nr:pseudouridine synthase [Nitrospira sp.]MDR4501301.1 pseudouridine synthase [Nitrospirales bacterium]
MDVSPHKYLVFNKPYGILSSFTDSDGRPTLAQYIKTPYVYAAGRLDLDSEGLLLLTSDARLRHRITDPRYKVWKTYWVQVERVPTEEALSTLRSGVFLKGKKTRPAKVKRLSSEPCLWPRAVPIRYRKHVPTEWLQIEIREGVNRQIRRMTATVGYPTLRLARVRIGSLYLEHLQPGESREMTKEEVDALYQSCFDH